MFRNLFEIGTQNFAKLIYIHIYILEDIYRKV